jgi:hypothetical protein
MALRLRGLPGQNYPLGFEFPTITANRAAVAGEQALQVLGAESSFQPNLIQTELLTIIHGQPGEQTTNQGEALVGSVIRAGCVKSFRHGHRPTPFYTQ